MCHFHLPINQREGEEGFYLGFWPQHPMSPLILLHPFGHPMSQPSPQVALHPFGHPKSQASINSIDLIHSRIVTPYFLSPVRFSVKLSSLEFLIFETIRLCRCSNTSLITSSFHVRFLIILLYFYQPIHFHQGLVFLFFKP